MHFFLNLLASLEKTKSVAPGQHFINFFRRRLCKSYQHKIFETLQSFKESIKEKQSGAWGQWLETEQSYGRNCKEINFFEKIQKFRIFLRSVVRTSRTAESKIYLELLPWTIAFSKQIMIYCLSLLDLRYQLLQQQGKVLLWGNTLVSVIIKAIKSALVYQIK